MRRAASLAIDRKGINEALTLGYSKITGNSIIPDTFEFYWQPPAPAYDPAKAKQLLAEAGYPNGFDAGEYYCDCLLLESRRGGARQPSRGRHPRQAAAARAGSLFRRLCGNKKLKNIIQSGSGAFGNAATRLEAFVVKGGAYAYGSYPEIDALFQQQAVELDHKKRDGDLAQDAAARPRARRSLRRSGSWPSSTAWGRGSVSRGSG